MVQKIPAGQTMAIVKEATHCFCRSAIKSSFCSRRQGKVTPRRLLALLGPAEKFFELANPSPLRFDDRV